MNAENFFELTIYDNLLSMAFKIMKLSLVIINEDGDDFNIWIAIKVEPCIQG